MAYQHLEPISKQLTIVVGLTVVGFMAFGLALSYYRNILFEQTLINIVRQNDILREGIAKGYRDLEYYRSGQYRDKYAKENLGLVNAGEQALILSSQPIDALAATEEEYTSLQQREVAYEELLRQMPTPEHWKLFLFHAEKIDELKYGL